MAPVFAHTFLVTDSSNQPSLRVVSPDDANLRKKRPHRKSRLGCIRCKRRKVKCDEADPCGNCVKRREQCVPSLSGSHLGAEPRSRSLPRELPSPMPVDWTVDEELNLVHMELLHHFEHFTVSTIIFRDIWPRMLQRAFRSQEHTFLVNAMLSLAAAHLEYLHPDDARYHRAKYTLLDRTLHNYRCALSSPITSSNCDALFGGAVLVHYLLWSDLSFLDCQDTVSSLNLSQDRLYWLSTGQRQIYFMAWPLFQTNESAFRDTSIIGPCMTLADEVNARGLPWQRFVRAFEALYDNPCYQGPNPTSSSPFSQPPSDASTPSSPDNTSPSSYLNFASTLYPPPPPAAESGALPLWESYKDGEAFVSSGGAPNEARARAAYLRLAERVAQAMAFLEDSAPGEATSCIIRDADRFRSEHVVRHALTFSMFCFGPLLPLISAGDSRVLVLLYHVYQLTGKLLPGEQFWWCKKRVEVMQRLVMEELGRRGLDVCLWGREYLVLI